MKIVKNNDLSSFNLWLKDKEQTLQMHYFELKEIFSFGSKELIQRLSDSIAFHDILDLINNEERCFFYLIEYKRHDLLDVFYSTNLDLTVFNKDKSCYYYCVKNDDYYSFLFLKKKKVKIKQPKLLLETAIQNNNLKMLKFLLEKQKIKIKKEYYFDLLLSSLFEGVDITQFLIDLRIDVNVTNKSGKNVLQEYISLNGVRKNQEIYNFEGLKLLIDLGLDINYINKNDDKSALSYACNTLVYNLKLIIFLIENDAKTNFFIDGKEKKVWKDNKQENDVLSQIKKNKNLKELELI